jgi:hypothetical protein
MKREYVIQSWFLVIVIALTSFNVSSSVDINCRVRDQSESTINSGSVSGGVIGNQNIYVPKSSTKSWSLYYTVMVRFYSGAEFNELVGKVAYGADAIIAAIEWPNGAANFILTRLTSSEKFFTADQITSNFNSTSGRDLDNKFWEIVF